MKRKQRLQEERRRPQAELNMLDDQRRLAGRRRGCGGLFGLLLLGVAAGAGWLALGLH